MFRNILIWGTISIVLQYTECSSLSDLITGFFNATSGTVSGKITINNGTENPAQMTPIPFLTKVKDINKFSADMMHGDYVGAGIDGIDFLETFQTLKWPVKIILKLLDKVLKVIHPVYLKIFPHAKNNGTFVDNLMFSVKHGGGMMKGVMKMVSMFQ